MDLESIGTNDIAQLRKEVARLRAESAGLRQELEQTANRSDLFLQRVLDVLPVGVFISDEQGGIAWTNAAVEKIQSGAMHVPLERIREYKGWQSEEKLRRAMSIGSVGILFFDMDSNFLDANDAFLRMIGHDREELERGELRSELVTLPEWMPRTRQVLQELTRSGRFEPYAKEARPTRRNALVGSLCRCTAARE